MVGKKWWILGILLTAAGILCFGEGKGSAELPVFSQPEQTVAALATSPRSEVEFPCVLRETGLILQNLARYDGLFPEGEEEREVVNAAALMVYNPGVEWIRSAKILVTQGGQDFLFEITCLPPNSRVLVVEKSAKNYSEAPVDRCRCLSFSSSKDTLLPGEIGVTDTQSGFAVENRAEQEIHGLTVYYKQYMADGDFYLGGYTYKKELTELAPGEHREMDAYRYVPGHSRVVAAEWNE